MKDELGVFPILKLKTNISIVKTEKKKTNKQTKQRRWQSRSHPHSCFSLSFTDKSESFVNDSPSASMTFKPIEVKVEKIKLPVVEFPEEEAWLKWLLRISTIALLVTLIGLWIRFA